MASPSGNVFSALSLATQMEASVSKEASPQLKTPYDAIALACHAGMIAVGFRLIGLGEDHKLDTPSDPQQVRSLPTEWNASSSSFAFRYAHNQSAMEFLLKVNRMGNKAVIMGMALGDDKTTSFDLRITDYISESSLPATPVKTDQTPEEARKAIIDIFISNGRLSDLGALLRLNIIQKLLPSLHKEGYEEQREAAQSSTGQASRPQRDPLAEDPQPQSARRNSLHHPLAQPRRPIPSGDFPPPDFDDEYEMVRPPHRPIGGPGFGNIGHRDLYPAGLGPNDPFRGSMGPGLGGVGGGGMHPTFDDPLFQGQGGGHRGYDPQAPPGSRYDPVGPGGAPRGSGGGGFPGQGGMGGRPHNPFGGFGGGDFI